MPTNLTQIVYRPPFAGVISLFTASFYKLDPTGRVPIEPLADVVPSVTPNRVALDMVDQENHVQNYTVTRNVLQDFQDTTPNVHREPIEATITGTLTAVGPVMQVPTFGFRFDLLRIWQLEQMAEKRRPIMVVSPRISLASAFISSISRPWTPRDGRSTVVTVNLVEARIISPTDVAALPDTTNLEAGDVQSTGASSQATPTNASVAQQPPVSQVPPVFDGSSGTVGP